MDIDENTGQGTPPSQPPQPGDVEQFLLHQFSRMGTTDHDELVNQLQKVLGNQLNYNTARFFLDMNNWFVSQFQNIKIFDSFFTVVAVAVSQRKCFCLSSFFSGSFCHVRFCTVLRLCVNVFILIWFFMNHFFCCISAVLDKLSVDIVVVVATVV